MTEIALGLALAAAIALYAVESRAWRAERRDLLNRVMARNYNEYAHTVTATTSETPQMTSDEAEAAWAIAHATEADAAWHAENRRLHPELYPDEEAA